MMSIPDAPWIRGAERYGTSYTSSWYGFDAVEEDDDEDFVVNPEDETFYV